MPQDPEQAKKATAARFLADYYKTWQANKSEKRQINAAESAARAREAWLEYSGPEMNPFASVEARQERAKQIINTARTEEMMGRRSGINLRGGGFTAMADNEFRSQTAGLLLGMNSGNAPININLVVKSSELFDIELAEQRELVEGSVRVMVETA